MSVADERGPLESRLRLEPFVWNGRQRLLQHLGSDPASQCAVRLVDQRRAADQGVIGDVVGTARRGVGAFPAVLVGQRRAVIDEVKVFTPEQHVRVAPGSVGVAHQRVEPDDPAGQFAGDAGRRRVEVDGSGQEVDAQIEPSASPEQILNLLVGLAGREAGFQIDRDQIGHQKVAGSGQLRAHHLGDKSLPALAGAAELDHVRAEVVGFHEPGQRPALTQRRHVARRGHLREHVTSLRSRHSVKRSMRR